MDDICVAHLVRAQNGPEPFRDFIESYRAHPAGVNHMLLIIFKGFGEHPDLSEYQALLQGVSYQPFFVPDEGFDIIPYFRAAEAFEYQYLCFMNSFSMILEDEWLAKMYNHGQREEVGAVGATGSWASHYSWARWELGESSVYADIMPDLQVSPLIERPTMFELSAELKAKIRSMILPRRVALWLFYYGLGAPYYLTINSARFYSEKRKLRRAKLRTFKAAEYDPFPAPHVRTNAFMIRRNVMLDLRCWEILLKSDASKFESGRESMTNQVLRMGLKVLVVGRDGCAYEKEEWPDSETFWQGEQRNTLVADNQTRHYDRSDTPMRSLLSRLAWGWKAAPSAPGSSGEESAS